MPPTQHQALKQLSFKLPFPATSPAHGNRIPSFYLRNFEVCICQSCGLTCVVIPRSCSRKFPSSVFLPSAPGETWWLTFLEVLLQLWVPLGPASLPLCILTYLGLRRDWSSFSLLSKHKDPRQSLPLAPYSQLSQPVLLGKRVLCCLFEPSFRLDHLNYCLAIPRY